MFYPFRAVFGKLLLVRQFRGSHFRMCPRRRRRSSIAVTAALSPSSAQSVSFIAVVPVLLRADPILAARA